MCDFSKIDFLTHFHLMFFWHQQSLISLLSSLADIGANLTDEVFDGVYSGSKKHDPDRAQVLERAWQIGVERIILTVGTIFDCEPAFKIAATDGGFVKKKRGLH